MNARQLLIERSVRWGHFHRVDTQEVYVFCPECRTRVHAAYETATSRSGAARERGLRAAMRDHVDDEHPDV